MNEIEQLAVMQALYNVIGGEVKTGKHGNLRDRVNAHYTDLYEQTGATGFEVRLNGQKIGTYGFSKTKAEPTKVVTTIEVVDYDMLRAYDDDNWLDWIGRWTVEHIGELAREYVEDTGEVLPGVAVHVEEIPAKPEGIRPNGTLRVYPDKVAQAMGPRLGEAVRGLLEGGGGVMREPDWGELKERLSNLTVKQLRVLTGRWFVGDMGGATTKGDIIHIMLIQMASWYRAPEQIGHGRIANVLTDLAKVERGEL